MPHSPRNETERHIRQLEARVAHQRGLAAQLARHGYKGAAAEALSRVAALQTRISQMAAVLLAA